MSISQLQAKADRLERELQKTRQLLAQANHDPVAVTADLVRTRAYAFNATTRPVEEMVEGVLILSADMGSALLTT
ncbi:TPA: hypothetical protein EYN98_31710 [Candidatus Poribacteria bacterium]|jgi:hypothetical protein|nr:hypothetical protein [Candidatus Poribacteria bacterium]HIB88299.1 hypothetical protein [Candidatus Poribacteria bacterium]HIN31567.1 hypothetical protein [Candidatus Poribacteria bacterium]HIO45831.1 hypothetical protein [Candidatus Poribacteria bacterium]HIO81837.1 hypothetical protein [Candidatus Poribacteria bacterium]